MKKAKKMEVLPKTVDEIAADVKQNNQFMLNELAITPSVCCQSMLFTPITLEKHRKIDKDWTEVSMFLNDNYKIAISKRGPDLDQRDLSLILWFLSIADKDYICKFTPYKALKGMGLTPNSSNYKWFEESMDRMRYLDVRFYIRVPKKSVIYDGTLIGNRSVSKKEDSENSGTHRNMKLNIIQLNSFSRLLIEDNYTYINLTKRKKIKNNQLACFLYGWFRSNKGQNVFYIKKEDVLLKLKKEYESNIAFVRRLKKIGLDPLVGLGILVSYSIEKDVITLVWDEKYDIEKKRLSEEEKCKLKRRLNYEKI